MIKTYSYLENNALSEQLKAALAGQIESVEPFLGSCLDFHLEDKRGFGVMYCAWTIRSGGNTLLTSDSCRSDCPEDLAFLIGRLIHTVEIADDTIHLFITGDYELVAEPRLGVYDQDDALISIEVTGGYMAILPNARVEVEVADPQ